MPFAPHEIENKRFVVALRGYQTDEVDAFLRAVAADYRAALDAARAAVQQVAELSDRAELVAEIERVMSAARETAEQEATEIRRHAEREAAEVRAAVREAEACYEEISRQAEQLHRIEARLRDQLHALEHVVAEGRETLAGVPQVYVAARSTAVG
ncbi:MAG TPA: DivIVA domain-containing protein [Gaiellaceae bacterium]